MSSLPLAGPSLQHHRSPSTHLSSSPRRFVLLAICPFRLFFLFFFAPEATPPDDNFCTQSWHDLRPARTDKRPGKRSPRSSSVPRPSAPVYHPSRHPPHHHCHASLLFHLGNFHRHLRCILLLCLIHRRCARSFHRPALPSIIISHHKPQDFPSPSASVTRVILTDGPL